MAPSTVRPHRGIGIYLRKSSSNQGDLSLPAQERIIRAVLVEPSGQPVYRVYRDILSGTRADRGDYQQMLADARAGKLTAVCFHKVNRFGRDSAEGLAAINELRRLGVEIRVADLPTLDVRKPEGMFVFSFLLAQGQYEVENLGSEAIKGMREMVLAGGWPFVAPDGYRNCREHLNSHRRRCWVEVDRPRAAIIRLIFRWYARETMTLAQIANSLNTLHGQRSAGGKSGCLTKTGGEWRMGYIWKIVTNPFYIGSVVVPAWDITTQGAHRAIVSVATFDRVQAVLASHNRGPIVRHHYLLQNRVVMTVDRELIALRCVTVTQKNRRYYYRTDGRKRRHVDADVIDATVVARLHARIAELGADPCATIARRMHQSLAGAQAQARAVRNGLTAQRKRLLRLAVVGQFSEAEVAGEMFRLNGQMEEAERECQRIAGLSENQEQMIIEWQQTIREVQQWDDLSTEEQQRLGELLIQQVEVDLQGTVTTITWTAIWDQLGLSH
ncbi:recombinase family protein [Chloroflexales bacterium ZM16-3]|nr:recombinase family protein [Chloroflexales bacterium ZM16-3]